MKDLAHNGTSLIRDGGVATAPATSAWEQNYHEWGISHRDRKDRRACMSDMADRAYNHPLAEVDHDSLWDNDGP